MTKDSFSKSIINTQAHYTAEWHVNPDNTGSDHDAITVLVIQQHRFNFDLWHEEDKAREPNVSDSTIAVVKRNIDGLNQNRNDTITKIDIALEELDFKEVGANNDLPWNSETIGSIIDRLSIASLKVFHMQEQVEREDASAEHVESCKEKVAKLTLQLQDLATSLQQFYDDVLAGKKQNKLYHQFKMYNDPELNPLIYKSNND